MPKICRKYAQNMHIYALNMQLYAKKNIKKKCHYIDLHIAKY